MKISIIHPTRGRPRLCENFFKDFYNKRSRIHEIEYILGLDDDDVTLQEYNNIFGKIDFIKLNITTSRNHVQAVNNAAKISTGELLIVTGEDWLYPFNWDQLLAEIIKLNNKNPLQHELVIAIKDGIQPRLLTLPILSRKLYNNLGYIYWHEYESVYSDTEFTEVAYLKNCVLDGKHLLFRHLHYTIHGGMKRDVIYDIQNAPSRYRTGEIIFNRRKQQNFGL